MVSLRPESSLIRAFTRRVAVVFDCETRLAREYHGPIAPVDAPGRSLNGAVDYDPLAELD